MNTPPRSNLPRLTLPWGRWLESSHLDTTRLIEREKSNAHSLGSVLGAQMSNIAAQIRGLAVSEMLRIQIPDFSVTTPMRQFGDDPVNYLAISSQVSINSPAAGVGRIVLDAVASVPPGNSASPTRPTIRVNGVDHGGVGGSFTGEESLPFSTSVAADIRLGLNTIQIAVGAPASFTENLTSTISNISMTMYVAPEGTDS